MIANPFRLRGQQSLSLWHAILLVMLPFSAGYFLSYLYRTINSVIGDTLRAEFSLSNSDIGLLTSAYLFTFAAFQVPLGVLLDKYGPRRVHAALLLIAAAGALVFSLGESRNMLLLGRGMIGLGVSAALMASFKAITQWFPQQRWPLINGLFLGVGGLGALAGTAPVQAALQITDWRGIFQALAIATVGAAAAIFLIVPDRRSDSPPPRWKEALGGLKTIYGSRIFWSIAPMVIASLGTSLAVQGLWAGLWLRDVDGLDPNAKASALLILNLGMTCGFVGNGIIADIAQRRGVSLAKVTSLCVTIVLCVQMAIVLLLAQGAPWIWFLFGFFANSVMFCYPIIVAAFPTSYAGRANTAVNLSAFIGGFTLQFAIGGITDLFGKTASGGYSTAAYQTAFAAVLGLQIAGFLWFLYRFSRARVQQTEAQEQR